MLASLATFVLFYLMTVFALSWGTTALGYRRETFLLLQLVGVVFFALAIPVSAMLAERSRRGTLLGVSVAIAVVRPGDGADARPRARSAPAWRWRSACR